MSERPINMDVIPRFFKTASTEERLAHLARALGSATWNYELGTFGEVWNNEARLALRDLEEAQNGSN